MEFHSRPRDHAGDVRAAAGPVLCRPCVRRLEGDLRALPGLHQEGLYHILPASRRRNPTKVSGSRKRDHLNLSALDARNNSLAVLEAWCRFVAEKTGAVVPDRHVPALAGFLLGHLEWLARQAPAAEFADEIEALHRELLRAIDPEPGDHNAVLVACVETGCPGKINVSPQRAATTQKSGIGCSAGHFWEMRELLAVRHLMNHQRKDAA
ncbi:hypothetical protein AB0N81_12345 [Streptomyces sp. NPDC093510]|uniref:hypothetical protein n=1 Tax=Streptomyces sp. NPDC093510 TaxID=3155199 RepID=UPI003441412F